MTPKNVGHNWTIDVLGENTIWLYQYLPLHSYSTKSYQAILVSPVLTLSRCSHALALASCHSKWVFMNCPKFGKTEFGRGWVQLRWTMIMVVLLLGRQIWVILSPSFWCCTNATYQYWRTSIGICCLRFYLHANQNGHFSGACSLIYWSPWPFYLSIIGACVVDVSNIQVSFPRYPRGLRFREIWNPRIPKPPIYAKIRLKNCFFSLAIRGFPLFSGPRISQNRE